MDRVEAALSTLMVRWVRAVDRRARATLVAVALALLWLIFNGVFQPLFGAATATLFQLDPVTGDVFVDGQGGWKGPID